MKKQEFKDVLKRKALQFQIKLEEKQTEQFYGYMQLLLKWNKKINLTTITNQEDIIEKHFIDSLSIFPYIKQRNKILDVGTGAGFPSIPLKIILPDKEITLLDSVNKKITFLNDIIKELKLTNIRAIHGRIEEFGHKRNERESYDIVTARALAKLNILIEYMLPFAKIGGKCICMKSCEVEEEIHVAEKGIKLLGGNIEKIEKIVLADTDIARKIIIVKKIKNTPDQYPRKTGIPTKKPLC